MGLTFCRRKPHASAFEACFHDQLVSTFHTARTNGPARRLISRILHVRLTLLQVGEFLPQEWAGIASGQPGQVGEDPCWSLVLEPMQHSLQPAPGESAPGCL